MASTQTAQPLPQEAARTGADQLAAEKALVPLPLQSAEGNLIALSGPVPRLPVELDVAIPVWEFRVRNLLALDAGQVIETQWADGEDLPIAAGDWQLAWSEFEVVELQLAVRITRLTIDNSITQLAGATDAVTGDQTQLTTAQTNLMQADVATVSTQLSLAETQQTALEDVIAQLDSASNSLFSKL